MKNQNTIENTITAPTAEDMFAERRHEIDELAELAISAADLADVEEMRAEIDAAETAQQLANGYLDRQRQLGSADRVVTNPIDADELPEEPVLDLTERKSGPRKKIPSMTSNDLLRRLSKAGIGKVVDEKGVTKGKGGHIKVYNPATDMTTTIPKSNGSELTPGFVRDLLSQLGASEDDIMKRK